MLSAQEYNFLDLSDKIESHGIYSLEEDEKGRLWIGLDQGGIQIYDGLNFSRPSFYDPDSIGLNIRALYKDSKGRMWVGSQTKGITIVHHGKAKYLGKHLLSKHVRCFSEDKHGRMWVSFMGGDGDSYNGGVAVFEKDTLQIFYSNKKGSTLLPSGNSRYVFADQHGKTWIATDKGLVLMQDGRIKRVYTEKDSLPHSRILCIAKGRDGAIWVGTKRGTSLIKNGKVQFTLGGEMNRRRIKSILTDKRGGYWFGTREGVFFLSEQNFNNRSWDFKKFTHKNRLGGNRIRTLYQDKSLGVWIGTYYRGISLFFNESFSLYSNREMDRNGEIKVVHRSPYDNSLWFGTEKDGLLKNHEEEDMGIEDLSEYVIGADIRAIRTHENLLYVGTELGLTVFDLDDIEEKSEIPFSGEGIVDFQIDAYNRVWILKEKGGITVLDIENGYAEMDTIEDELAQSIVEVKHLVAQDRKKIALVTNEAIHFFVSEQRNKVLSNKPIFVKGISSIAQYGEELYGYTKNDTIFSLKEGVLVKKSLGINDRIRFLAKTSDTHYWSGGYNRLFSITERNGDFESKKFSKEEGFMGKQVFTNSFFLDQDSSLWLGTTEGALKIDAKPYVGVKRDLKIHFTNIELTDTLFKLQEYCDTIIDGVPQNLKLPYQASGIEFSFLSVHLKQAKEVEYRYKLVGHDENFSKPNHNTEEVYTGLSPGKYSFIVQSRTPWGDWSTEPLVFNFIIEPAFWQTLEFIIPSAIVFVVMIYLIITYRTRKLSREKEKLERVVAERTADLAEEKKKSEELLLNILPEEIADELKVMGVAKTQKYSSASVLFTDFKGFTALSAELSPEQLVKELDRIFMAFDDIIAKHHIEKIKTIGDAYMCVSGIPKKNNIHAIKACLAGLEIISFMKEFNNHRNETNQWNVRVGVHTGELIAGVVGKKKFAYDVWGDTVNVASRMESSSEINMLNISADTYELVKDYFECTHRGKVEAKNKGELDMYFVHGLKGLYKGASHFIPNQLLNQHLKAVE